LNISSEFVANVIAEFVRQRVTLRVALRMPLPASAAKCATAEQSDDK